MSGNASTEHLNGTRASQSRLDRILLDREAGSDAFVRTRAPWTSEHQPHGGAQQAMVLSCESMAGQRHAGSARARKTGRLGRRTDNRERRAFLEIWTVGAGRRRWVMTHLSLVHSMWTKVWTSAWDG
jgi:hypothetical protein